MVERLTGSSSRLMLANYGTSVCLSIHLQEVAGGIFTATGSSSRYHVRASVEEGHGLS